MAGVPEKVYENAGSVFRLPGSEHLSSECLAQHLEEFGHPRMSGKALAAILRPYGIKPVRIRANGRRYRGYRAEDFERGPQTTAPEAGHEALSFQGRPRHSQTDAEHVGDLRSDQASRPDPFSNIFAQAELRNTRPGMERDYLIGVVTSNARAR